MLQYWKVSCTSQVCREILIWFGCRGKETIRTVIEHEPGLLSEQEVDALEVFSKLACKHL